MADTRISSELGAIVMVVEARVGDRVAEGDCLLVLTAMKMEIAVTAPHDGIVRQIFVEEGAAVEEGDTLVALARA
jgi:biotin carboxyl carrier protein